MKLPTVYLSVCVFMISENLTSFHINMSSFNMVHGFVNRLKTSSGGAGRVVERIKLSNIGKAAQPNF